MHYSRFHNGTDGTDLKYYIPIKDNIWRMVLETLGLVMAFYFVVTVSILPSSFLTGGRV